MYINKQLKMYSHTQKTVRLSNSQYSLYHVYVIGMVLGNKMLKQSINEFEITTLKKKINSKPHSSGVTLMMTQQEEEEEAGGRNIVPLIHTYRHPNG